MYIFNITFLQTFETAVSSLELKALVVNSNSDVVYLYAEHIELCL